MARARGLPALVGSAASHLALTEHAAGRERACAEAAGEASRLLAEQGAGAGHDAARAQLARALAGSVEPPTGPGAWGTRSCPPDGGSAHPADPGTRFWQRVHTARVAWQGGDAAEAEHLLRAPWEQLPGAAGLPVHLRVVVLVERALVAVLRSDAQGLDAFTADLAALGAAGESALAAGLRADLAGARAEASAQFAVAARDASYAQPPSREVALVCEAQLLDSLGQEAAAYERLAEACRASELRRNAVAFLGWSRQGTPLGALLRRFAAAHPTPWTLRVAADAASRPDLVFASPVTVASPGDPAAAAAPAGSPGLSPREREVLVHLARGETYDDIAAALFVSGNTVKTHVSHLYAKLGVGRRSEALAVARTLHLV
nr:helix-turn-helix domain-containing protein [Nocardioides sp. zg-DK7169]